MDFHQMRILTNDAKFVLAQALLLANIVHMHVGVIGSVI
jgi:hypothetical protein